MFTVIWFNPTKNLYDNYYIPNDYLTPTKARLTNNTNYSDYLDTVVSLSQVHSYLNGYDLVDNIFTEEVANWIKGNKVNYSKYKKIVDKVSIK